VTKIFSPLMALIYEGISAILLFWHSVWHKMFGDASWLGTNWSWVLGIVFLVLTVRAVLFPIFVKQIKSQRAMQAIQPKMKELQQKHKGDRESLQKEVMELYKTEKVNPLMGCLPMFLQIPVFIGLLHVLRHLRPNISDSKKQLYGWTADQFDSAVLARLFNAPIVAQFRMSAKDVESMNASSTTVKVVAAILVVMMISTTYMTQRQMIKKTGWNEDPQQRMIQKFMLYGIPFFTLTSGWYFPIGVIIYWVTNNLITLGQQYWVLHKYPPPKTVSKSGVVTSAAGGKSGAAPAKSGGILAAFKAAREQSGTTNGRKVDAAQATNGAKPKDTPKSARTPAAESAETRAAAPKPGAKPANPKKAGSRPAANTPKKGGAAKRQSG
jgi:YidC/Oxa1 family membrane protein insertase